MDGYKFRRQYSVENFIIDFYCPELKLAVEIDGESHITHLPIPSLVRRGIRGGYPIYKDKITLKPLAFIFQDSPTEKYMKM